MVLAGGHPLGKGCGWGLDGRDCQVCVLMWIKVEDVMNGKSKCVIRYVKEHSFLPPDSQVRGKRAEAPPPGPEVPCREGRCTGGPPLSVMMNFFLFVLGGGIHMVPGKSELTLGARRGGFACAFT